MLIRKGIPSDWFCLENVNWKESFPYKPRVQFRVWHEGDTFHIGYNVREQGTRALQTVLGGPVYEDSCVECFIQPDPADPHYYNFEFNPIGMMAMACRTGRNDPEDAPREVLESVRIETTAGKEPFDEKYVEEWSLDIAIPASALFNSGVKDFSGRRMRMNFFKCGDGLKVPHFVTWAPVRTPSPDYHRPEFFLPVDFE
ncbi:MAG: hypothetical protein MJY44_00230 [Bacteroidales bacterium]|nr:hypothetical protein [Bacteroidales bacterium]